MKTIKDFDLNDKKVIIRVDFNVPIIDGVITDDNRIIESLPTIQYAIDNNAKVILLSHLGRVKTEEDKQSLAPVSVRLSELLHKNVTFIPYTKGKDVEDAISNMKNKDVILLENTRYEDLNNNAESNNDLELGQYWASLGDIFINDAFGTVHRAHASNVGIANHLKSGMGFLVEKELNAFLPSINNPKRPFTVILGGAKIKDKISLIENLVTKADYILIGGGMAYTFLKALGFEIGNSLLDENNIDFCYNILKNNPDKIFLPIDIVTENRICLINEIPEDEEGLDIGPQTVELFKRYLEKSQTIIWNGPVGKFEDDKYCMGTKGICEVLKDISAYKVAGGGDTGSAVKKLGYQEVFSHISTGGGASLELLEGKQLPGIEVLKNSK